MVATRLGSKIGYRSPGSRSENCFRNSRNFNKVNNVYSLLLKKCFIRLFKNMIPSKQNSEHVSG